MADIEKVKCQLCNFESEFIISSGHLKKHDITPTEYHKKFPNAKMSTDTYRDRMSSIRKVKVEEDNDIIVEDDGLSDIESAPKNIPVVVNEDLDLFVKIEELRKDSIKEGSRYFEDPNNMIPTDKLHILNYLVNLFSKYKIENNYFVEKKFLNGSLDYRFVTDIAIPELMLDVEFPNAFWHNYDRPKEIRDDVLKFNGWTVININERVPTITAIDEALKAFIKKKKIK